MNSVLIFNLAPKYFNNHTKTLAMFMSWFSASCFWKYVDMQGDSRRKIKNFGGDNIHLCEENIYMNMCLIRTDYRNKDIWNSRSNSVSFLFLYVLGKDRIFRKGNWINRTNCLLIIWVPLRARKIKTWR